MPCSNCINLQYQILYVEAIKCKCLTSLVHMKLPNDGLFISPTKETSLCNSDLKNDLTRCSGAQFEPFSIMFSESKETSHLGSFGIIII